MKTTLLIDCETSVFSKNILFDETTTQHTVGWQVLPEICTSWQLQQPIRATTGSVFAQGYVRKLSHR